jgi:threonine dehydrogenase-like Zn-dependent dehydrogenase
VLDGPAGLPDVLYAASPLVACNSCEFCADRRWNLCRRGGDLIGFGRNGGLAEWVDVPLQNLTPMAPDLSPSVAVLAEPMAVATRGVLMAAIGPADHVLVLGGGTIGLLAAAVAATRATQVTMSVRYPHQGEVASGLGVDVIGEDDAVVWGKQVRPSVVIETVGGRANTLDVAIDVARRGGRIIVLGTFANIPVNLFAAGQKELVFLNSFGYGSSDGRDDFEVGAALLDELAGPLSGLVSHRFGLDQVAEAFASAGDKSSGAIKVMVVPR